MVKLILDFDKLYEGGQQVTSVSDYVKAYTTLVEAIGSSETVELVVRDRTCALWLQRALRKYGIPSSSVVDYNARSATEQAWNVSVPLSFSDTDLAHDSLWTLIPTIDTNDDFENGLLRTYYGPEFTSAHLPIQSLGKLFAIYDPKLWSKNTEIHCAHIAYSRRLKSWQDHAQSSVEKMLVGMMVDDFATSKAVFEKYALLRTYPEELGQHIMGQNYDVFRDLNVNTFGIVVGPDALDSVTPHVTVYLNNYCKEISDLHGLDTLLTHLSGQMMVEFQAVSGVIARLSRLVDSAVIDSVKHIFKPIQQRLESKIKALYDLLSPKYPSSPDQLSDVSHWIDWTVNEYLPYRFWCERNARLDATLDEYCQMFQDWLYTNYHDIAANSNLALHKSLMRIRDWIPGPSKHLLVIIVDNLGVRFLPALQKAFTKRGFASTNTEYAVASLPTETAVGKKCLLSGNITQSDNATQDYSSLIDKWKGFFGDRSLYYLSNISKINDILPETPSVYFLNYLVLDDMLHKDQDATGKTYYDSVDYYFDGLADQVCSWSDRNGISQDLQIAVVADHGSVLMDARAANLIDTAFFKTFAEDRHHRFLRLSDDELLLFPGNLQSQCFLFPRQQYGLSDNYAVAQRYYRFSNTSDGCYAHGGLSPEEVVVPVVMMSRALSVIEMPIITLKSKVFRYGNPAVFELVITNPGSFQIEDVSCNLSAEGLQCGSAFCAAVNAVDMVSLSTNGKFTNTGRQVNMLKVNASFVLAGKNYDIPEIDIPIEVKAIVERNERRFK
ncbi:MAG: alkaline phosphatase family protein [Armatimonadota bacterium]